jgi:hypothetical protein
MFWSDAPGSLHFSFWPNCLWQIAEPLWHRALSQRDVHSKRPAELIADLGSELSGSGSLVAAATPRDQSTKGHH